jgi:hypothetical protein
MNEHNIVGFYLKVAIVFALLPVFLFLSRVACAEGILTDIKGHWAEKTIMKAMAEGYVNGYPDGTFGPDRSVSKAEFMVMVVKAMKIPVAKTEEDTNWYSPFIHSLEDLDLYRPDEADEKSWTENLSRAEMARFVLRTILSGADSGSEASDSDGGDEPALKKMVFLGIIEGFNDNGDLSPDEPLTRAQAVVVIERLLQRLHGASSD